ncbi:hypothetical protein ISN45_Aa08g000880 [Arabidopsis thaliana x Arabidopsis arenosa]|uniref:Transmembrane protein n=1 Tax=Arabidopsis thaliana x Arabidopsis arenosa TaxID=1240361 RepID=A0A8T1XLR0_9BRAS|nr:hypothetical protein ISN45_Aa08g000880 [Arabidopsis thaliana x Arabidopsis arenosa]
MLSKELKAETRFRSAQVLLLIIIMLITQTVIVTVSRRGTREATVPIRFDELQAALLRISITKADLKKATSNEREFQIKIEQGEEQLRRATIRPSQGLLPTTAPLTRRSSTHRSSR